MKVPFVDLSFVTNSIKSEYLQKIAELLDRGQFILSPEVAEFESAWAKYLGGKYCVGVSNGADALYLALIAAGVKAGREVIIQGNAYNACVTAILRTGAIPRFADINEATLMIDANKIEGLINKNTAAIMPVHLYGNTADMGSILEIAKKHNLKIIEDCAQAHGATFNGQKVGTFGDVAAFSFYPTKNLGAFGDAGAVVTNNKTIYQEIFARRNLGQTKKNEHQYLAGNMRLDPIQAIALSLKLKTLDEVTGTRQKAGEYYNKLITESNIPVKIPQITKGATYVYHLYVILLLEANRESVRDKLTEQGIQTEIHYPLPVYRQPFYRGPKDPCPITDKASDRILSLPMFYGITPKQQEYIVESLSSILRA